MGEQGQIWADFNDVDQDGCVTTLARTATVQLRVGQSIVAGDREGNTARGLIVEIVGELVKIDLNA